MNARIEIRCADNECRLSLEEMVRRYFSSFSSTTATDARVIIWDKKMPWEEGFAPAALLVLADAPTDDLPPAGRYYTMLRPLRLEKVRRKLQEILAALKEEVTLTLPPPLTYDSRQRILARSDNGQREELTELEARLFTALMQAEGTMLSRQALLTGIWGYSEQAETRTLEAHIYRLRQKLTSLQDGVEAGLEIITHEDGYEMKRRA